MGKANTEILTTGAADWYEVARGTEQGLRLTADAVVGAFWDDLTTPAVAVNPPGAASDPDRDNTDGTLLFDKASTELVFLQFQLPHRYLEGSEVRFHIHWTQAASGAVAWQARYKWWTNGGAKPAAWTDLGIVSTPVWTYTSGTLANITEWPAIPGTGKNISSLMIFELSRVGANGADTYDADAKLESVDLHYLNDGRGSEREYIKDF